MATKLDLKFDVQSSKQSELTSIFLVCDAYYVEICCQDNGHVASVKLAQANNQVDEHTVILSFILKVQCLSMLAKANFKDLIISVQCRCIIIVLLKFTQPYPLQADSEVLTQLVRALNFDAFEFHLGSLKDFYAHGAGTNDVANMFRVLSSLESVLLSITKCRYGKVT